MAAGQDEAAAGPTLDGRHESPIERLDRHWSEILHELRVARTGIDDDGAGWFVLPAVLGRRAQAGVDRSEAENTGAGRPSR
ncbi:hypothetical protein J4G33_04160 [Actinotalea sp. BY-33]|uniref:Uncharacterized protein n=1 Tax=Actinotalea soli TaxID=2819234 RepID=A0A939LNF1_9CELL|nr:DUF6328 family protein [Actinotalea soli]MBO1750991.1 hypothetical protein [Actinotalea soli]